MQRRKKVDGGTELVTAAEIAAFVYCNEQWRHEHGLGLEPSGRPGTWVEPVWKDLGGQAG
jgi:hypothetical protein